MKLSAVLITTLMVSSAALAEEQNRCESICSSTQIENTENSLLLGDGEKKAKRQRKRHNRKMKRRFAGSCGMG